MTKFQNHETAFSSTKVVHEYKPTLYKIFEIQKQTKKIVHVLSVEDIEFVRETIMGIIG